jgi:hypothetical protein
MPNSYQTLFTLKSLCIRVILLASLLSASLLSGANAQDLLTQFLSGPMSDIEEVVFANRQPGVDHWYGSFGYYADNADQKTYWEMGRLCKLNLRTGKVAVLLEDLEGAVRDPQVHYDAEKILFSYRKGGTDYFHLYEINVDGSNLRQLTDGPWDDMEPTYLPDGDIMFVSSRCKRWVNCWMTQVAVLHSCDGDGSNTRQISANIEHDNTPWTLPDGRVLYTRWEYVDRSQVKYHHLWTANPDGTRQWVYYGNQHPGTLMIDAKPIPNSRNVIAVFSPGHGRPEHTGAITIVSPESGPDDLASTHELTNANKNYRDPYPISEDCFLIAQNSKILLLNGRGETQEIYSLPPALIAKGMESHEPRPIRRRPREQVIPPRIDPTQATGRLALMDIYAGRNMEGVTRGEIKSLLVLETLPKPINFSGGMEPLSHGGTFTLERVLGTVPVEEDGSAFMELPADRSLFFVALDAEGNSVKRMQSFLAVRPGETTSCSGCHEQRSMTPVMNDANTVQAMSHKPSVISPVTNTPDVFDFPRDIQPILDRYCVSCHDTDQREGNVLLAGDRGPLYSHSYYTLTIHSQVADGRNLAESNYVPRGIGSSASPLMRKIDGSHYDVTVSDHERTMIRLWIESGAAYPGTYAALGTGMIGSNVRDNIGGNSRYNGARNIVKRRCNSCHTDAMKLPDSPSDEMGLNRSASLSEEPRMKFARHIIYNLTRPDQSLFLLAPLAKEAGGYGICRDSSGKEVFQNIVNSDYLTLLSMVRFTAKRLHEIKRFDIPGFKPHPAYIREMQRFGILPKNLASDAAIDVYKTDQAYWKSLWYQPKQKLSSNIKE